MFRMRKATAADTPAVTEMIRSRCTWLEGQGLESWRDKADNLAGLAGAGYMWVLESEGRIVGCTTVTEHAPPKDWTHEEAAEERSEERRAEQAHSRVREASNEKQ